MIPISCHGLFPWQSAVVEGVHVDDLLRFHHDGRLGLVFEPALALEGNPQLVHHGTAEGPLWRKIEKKKENRMGFRPLPPVQMLWAREQACSPRRQTNFVAYPSSTPPTTSTQSCHRGKIGEIYNKAGRECWMGEGVGWREGAGPKAA